jgi:hypothetical protein
MTLPSHIILLNLERVELEGRLRALSEEYFIWARNEALTRWEASGAHTAQFVLHGRHEEGYDEAVQKVTEALKRDVYELTKILATLEEHR